MRVELGTVLSFNQAAGIIVGVAYNMLNIQSNRKNKELMRKTVLKPHRDKRLEQILSHKP